MAMDVNQLEQHRAGLTGHCYRMLGSAVDADDAVQETMVRAWRGLERFDGRSSVRTWLYRIATNVCIDALSERSRRVRSIDCGPVGTVDDVLESRPRTHWLEPVPDARTIPADVDPAEQVMLRQSIRLAFVAALQHLPPKQRAALLLTEVLGWSAAEVAETLESSVASVNSAVQRARATLSARNVEEAGAESGNPEGVKNGSLAGVKKGSLSGAPLSDLQIAVVDRYVEAFERYDVEALTALLTEDATQSMPPYTLWLRGHEAISIWMLGHGAGCRGSRLVRTMANGAPAFGHYRQGGAQPWAIVLLDLEGDRISGVTSFLDAESLFPVFGFPPRLPE